MSLCAALSLESTFIDQNHLTRHTAGPLNGAHRNWTYLGSVQSARSSSRRAFRKLPPWLRRALGLGKRENAAAILRIARISNVRDDAQVALRSVLACVRARAVRAWDGAKRGLWSAFDLINLDPSRIFRKYSRYAASGTAELRGHVTVYLGLQEQAARDRTSAVVGVC